MDAKTRYILKNIVNEIDNHFINAALYIIEADDKASALRDLNTIHLNFLKKLKKEIEEMIE